MLWGHQTWAGSQWHVWLCPPVLLSTHSSRGIQWQTRAWGCLMSFVWLFPGFPFKSDPFFLLLYLLVHVLNTFCISRYYLRTHIREHKYVTRQSLPLLSARRVVRDEAGMLLARPLRSTTLPCTEAWSSRKASLQSWLPRVMVALPWEHVRVPWKTFLSGSPLGLISFPLSHFLFNHLCPYFPNSRQRLPEVRELQQSTIFTSGPEGVSPHSTWEQPQLHGAMVYICCEDSPSVVYGSVTLGSH